MNKGDYIAAIYLSGWVICIIILLIYAKITYKKITISDVLESCLLSNLSWVLIACFVIIQIRNYLVRKFVYKDV